MACALGFLFSLTLLISFMWASNVLCMRRCEPTVKPGFPRSVNKSNPGVQRAVMVAVYEFNNRSNDSFLFKLLELEDAKVQVVTGLKYILEARLGRTVCRKREPYDLKNCAFQTETPLQQILNCHFEVWTVVWRNFNKVIVLLCV
ncbi:cystatin-F isoform X2 [Latimeria chalumnae]|uniref:cystatin-F isoform X2 n=1 Tax=Latimeria chalumnae TaxID=7897 RepID=UPI0003C1A0D0|nr:PREDICTED: cystatin-F [Latimeria chalumnae]|eukprot:XP_006005282.1 PREDICTED: cystatin-F [Latimeria chalumnae]